MKRGLLLIVMVLTGLVFIQKATGQNDTLNQYDKNGKMHGYWKRVKNDTLMYEGRFEHGAPTGLFIYYYGNKSIKSTVLYSDKGKVARTILYHPSGAMMAAGKYVDQKKDSTWRYYNEYEIMVSSEEYVSGKGHGIWKKYNMEGKVIEEVTYKDGVKEGDWIQYFDNGKVKLKATYRNNLLEGNFLLYYSSGVFCVSGRYEKSLPVGTWVFYNTKGEVERKDIYKDGRRISTEQILPVVMPDTEESRREVDAFRRQLRNWGIEM